MLAQRNKKINLRKIFYLGLPLIVGTAVLILAASIVKFNNEVDCGCRDIGNNEGDFASTETRAYFLNQPVIAPLAELLPTTDQVLGESSNEIKWIEVDLSDQKLIAWQGGQKYLETLVSTGKFNWTPTGEFRIWSKFKYIKMSGGSKEKGTYYYLPNVPFTMFFYKDYGLHGTYWHNNFGTPMSHGCVNLPTPMAEKLFYWANPPLPPGKNYWIAQNRQYGTRVVIHQ